MKSKLSPQIDQIQNRIKKFFQFINSLKSKTGDKFLSVIIIFLLRPGIIHVGSFFRFLSADFDKS